MFLRDEKNFIIITATTNFNNTNSASTLLLLLLNDFQMLITKSVTAPDSTMLVFIANNWKTDNIAYHHNPCQDNRHRCLSSRLITAVKKQHIPVECIISL